MTLIAFTGLRDAEARGECWEDIDLEEDIVRVRAQLARWKRGETARRVRVKTDSGHEREIELLPEVVAMLKRNKAEAFARGRAGAADYVFTTSNGTPIHHRNLAREIRRAGNAAGLNPEGKPPVSLHDLRHTAVSRWIASGLDLVTVSRMAGHADEAITARVYAHEFDKQRRRQDIREKLAAGTSIKLLVEREVAES